MGTLERRARARDTIRTKILDAARDLFARDGVEAVTMRAIARRIEYTPTTIYHHFRDKHTLLVELCRIDMASLAQASAMAAHPSSTIPPAGAVRSSRLRGAVTRSTSGVGYCVGMAGS